VPSVNGWRVESHPGLGCLAAMCQGQRVPDAIQHLIIKWHKEGAPLSTIVALMDPQVKPTAIKAIIKRFKETGWISVKGNKGPSVTDVVVNATEIVQDMIKAEPRLYQYEYQTWLQSVSEKANVSSGKICEIIQSLGITRQKITTMASQRRQDERSSFAGWQARRENQNVNRFFWLDETSKGKGDMQRDHGYGYQGEGVQCAQPFLPETSYSTLACFNSKGFVGWRHTSGTFDRARFDEDIGPVCIDHIGNDDIVICDNSKTHDLSTLRARVEAKGATLIALPAYSPDLNPIEFAFGEIKAWLQANSSMLEMVGVEGLLDMAFGACGRSPMATIHHCGYGHYAEFFKLPGC